MARLAFSRDRTVSPKPFSIESSATLTSSPTPHVDLAGVVPELFDRHDAFGLQAGVDHHHVAADFHDDAGDDGARLQLGQIGLALFKQFGK